MYIYGKKMEDNAVVYLGLALASLLFLLAWRRVRKAGHDLRLPPGPWTLPVIGSMHHIAGALPHRAMRDLARRHGWPVMLLWLGEVPTLVVSSREAAREVMKTHDTSFATRPLSSTVSVLTNGGRDIIFAPYGDYWRQMRKIAVTEVLTARRVLSFRAIREEETGAMLRAVAAVAAAGDELIDMRARMAALVSDTTARAVFGDRFKDRDLFLRELDRAIALSAGFNPADLWPSSRLAVWASGAVRRAEECRDTVFGILDSVIAEHQDRMAGEGGAAQEDVIDILLRVQKDGGLQFPMDMDSIKAVVFDIFGGGSETSATTLEWIMAELVRNPSVLRRATDEVRRAFQAAGAVVEQDLATAVPYLHLVIRETFRLHTPLPLLLPRECRDAPACKVLGYDVPQGTQVLVNAWAMGRDERYWPDDPEEFRPERFEAAKGDGGSEGVDFRGADFELLPFGAGRRMCPGMGFGLANVELALASLLLHFDWEAPGVADPAEFDMTEAFGITSRRKAGLMLRPVLRVPVPMPKV
uniref:Uncharacterized protein n=1 Tax=Avena sativa TaxID=4498 RepID=A0ACD6AAU7_AVESA